MVLAPRQVDVLAVGARAQHLRVAILELAVLLAELRDLGRADEREVLRPEEDDLPLARVVVVGDVLELLALLEAHGGLELERGELVSNGQHVCSLRAPARGSREQRWQVGLDLSKTLFLCL